MIVDMHCHYLPQALLRGLERRGSAPRVADRDGVTFIEYGPGSAVPLRTEFTDPQTILREMDEAGVNHSVLSVTIPGVDWFEAADASALADECNQETAQLCRAYPEQLSGLATVPLQFPDEAADVLRRAVEMGLKGAMIYSNVAGGHLDTPARRQFFDAAARLDVPILLHPTYPLCAPTLAVHGMIEVTGFLFDTTTAALRLIADGLYDRHPEFKFIVPHAGSLIPYFVGRINYFDQNRPGSAGQLSAPVCEHIQKLYVDSVCNWPPALELAVDFFGIDKVMLGSDRPFWPTSMATEVLDGLELDPADRAKIEYENAARLFQLQAALAGRD